MAKQLAKGFECLRMPQCPLPESDRLIAPLSGRERAQETTKDLEELHPLIVRLLAEAIAVRTYRLDEV